MSTFSWGHFNAPITLILLSFYNAVHLFVFFFSDTNNLLWDILLWFTCALQDSTHWLRQIHNPSQDDNNVILSPRWNSFWKAQLFGGLPLFYSRRGAMPIPAAMLIHSNRDVILCFLYFFCLYCIYQHTCVIWNYFGHILTKKRLARIKKKFEISQGFGQELWKSYGNMRRWFSFTKL